MDHKELDVWKKAIDFVKNVYKATGVFPKEEIYGLTNKENDFGFKKLFEKKEVKLRMIILVYSLFTIFYLLFTIHHSLFKMEVHS